MTPITNPNLPMTDQTKTGPKDGNGNALHEGDRVWTYDVGNALTRVYGTLAKNDHPEVSEWAVDYDDGESCAVIDFNQLYSAKYS